MSIEQRWKLAQAILNHRQPSETNLAVARAALDGASIDDLLNLDRAEEAA